MLRMELVPNILEYIEIKGKSTTYVISTITVLFIILLLLIFANYIQNYLIKRKERKAIWDAFIVYLEERNLTPEEIEIVKKMIFFSKENLENPYSVIHSINKFNSISESLGYSKNDKVIIEIKNKLGLSNLEQFQPITSTKELPIGSVIYYGFKNSKNQILLPGIVSSNNENNFSIELEKKSLNEVTDVRIGNTISLQFWKNNDANYACETEITGIDVYHPNIIILKHTNNIQRLQSREFFRMKYRVPVEFYVFDSYSVSEIKKKMLDKTYLESLTKESSELVDISGGGTSIKINRPLKSGTIVKIFFTDEIEGPFNMFCKVTRSNKTPANDYIIGLLWQEIDEHTRSSIIRIVNRESVKRMA